MNQRPLPAKGRTDQPAPIQGHGRFPLTTRGEGGLYHANIDQNAEAFGPMLTVRCLYGRGFT